MQRGGLRAELFLRGPCFQPGNLQAFCPARFGGDQEKNFKLRMAIDQARGLSVPKENIERAIKRGAGQGTETQLQETIYEGYGPCGVAIIIKVVTDNTNRAVSDLRHALGKAGGALAENGSVMWNFELKGVLRFLLNNLNLNEIELAAIDAGADDIKDEENGIIAYSSPKNLQKIKKTIEEKGAIIEFAGIEYIPKNRVELDEAGKKKLENLEEALDGLEDVNEYFTNDI